MTYSMAELWQMFLGNLEHNANEDIRHVYVLIERDRYQGGMHDQQLRDRVSSGAYGSTVQRMWGQFQSAND